MRAAGGWLARVCGAVVVAILLLGLPVLALQAPFVTRALVARYYDATAVGLPLPEALAAAEQVRAYTTDPAAPPLPTAIGTRPAFDESAASHLRDVRRVLLGARTLTFLAAFAGALLAAVAYARGNRRALAWSLAAGAGGLLVLALAAAAYAIADFESFFALFHGLFFAAGTWTFPVGSLLIELFPEPLWATLGALWAAGVAVLAVSCLAAAWILRRSHSWRARKYV